MAVTRMPVVVRVNAPSGRTRPPVRSGGARRTLRSLDSRPFVLLGFLAELGWGFFGSLGFGLGRSASAAGPGEARLWLASACVIGGCAPEVV